MNLALNIKNKQVRIGVIGLGYVGLPLGVTFAQEGYNVIGLDVDEQKVNCLNNGHSYIADVNSEALKNLVDMGKICATSDFSQIYNLDVICICVPTPLKNHQEPILSHIESVVINLKKYLSKDTLVILESTTYPGTTEELIQNELDKEGMQCGVDYYLCYSPERIEPGNLIHGIKNTPKVIGGITEKCREFGNILYKTITKKTVLVSSTQTAEMTKLLENTFRSVNIAFINEFALMCDALRINVWEVIEAASTKPYGFMPFYPGPGIGGHCIPLDPMYLSWKAREQNFISRFIELSQTINKSMPEYIVKKVSEILNIHKKSINGSRILLLGMSYKPNVNDLRESPSIEVYKLLEEKGAILTLNDPFSKSTFRDEQRNEIEIEEFIQESRLVDYDCIVLLQAHSVYNLLLIAESGVPILDTRNAFQRINSPNIIRIGDTIPTNVENKILAEMGID